MLRDSSRAYQSIARKSTKKIKSLNHLMEVDLGFQALALVTTQDTAGIFRQASGMLVSATKAISNVNLPGMGTIPCSADGIDVYTVVSCVRSSGGALLLFAVRFLTGLSPLTCLGATSDLERIFASKISLWEVAVTPVIC